ncbi:MAG: hypothetical protein IPF78_11850 [Flavobacteriales bacterium]|nr:hypothetical protein [Flavobacteriales bacterium]
MSTLRALITLEDAIEYRTKRGLIDAEGIRMMRRSIQLLKQRERFEMVATLFAPLVQTFGTR